MPLLYINENCEPKANAYGRVTEVEGEGLLSVMKKLHFKKQMNRSNLLPT